MNITIFMWTTCRRKRFLKDQTYISAISKVISLFSQIITKCDILAKRHTKRI